MKKVIITSLVAVALVLGSAASAQAQVVFSTNLTVGSTGTDVVALQSWLISNNFDIPAITSGAAAKGYFGQQTKAAVVKYQAQVGLPATGFVGPLTRAKLAGTAAGTVSTIVCPAGYVCTPAAGTVTTPVVVTPGVITTPGVEGTISATASNAGLVSTVYEGDKMAPILGIELEAKTSDIAVQRVKFRMDENTGGSDTKFYNKIYKKLYVTDGTNVLAAIDLNSSTIVKDGSNYYITLAGFNWVIPKNSKKTLVVKADLYENIDSSDFDAEVYQLGLAANGVRGVDGAGIDQFAGGTSDNGIARTVTIATTLSESATLTQSLNSASPKKQDVIAAQGSNEDELDKLTLASFDVRAEKDDVKITTLYVGVTDSGSGGADATTAYLYEGTTEIDSATITGDVAIFTNFDQIVPKNGTKTYTIKADIDNATGVDTRFVASTTAGGVVAENTKGDTVTVSGSVGGYSIGVRNRGPEITLLSKSIVTSNAPQTSGSNNIATSSLTANFVFRIKAVGGSLQFGLTQSTSSPFFASSTPASGVKSFTIYRNGVEVTDIGSYATSTSFTFPSLCTTTGTNTCQLAEGSSVDVPVTLRIDGRSATAALTSGLYSVGINGLNWSGTNSTFMDDEIDWITPEVAFP